MKRAFEKILERLEEQLKNTRGKYAMRIENTARNWERIKAYQEVIKILKEVIEEYEDGWIPCSDRLPEDGVPVLLQDSEGYYSLGVSETKRNIKGFRDGDWWGSANNYKAWQPLPEPYEEKE